MEENIQEESSLSLIDLINIFKKNFLIIITSTLLVMIIGIIYIFGVSKPTYKSTAVVMVQVTTSENINDSTDVTTGLRIVNTVAEFMQSESVIAEVAKDMKVSEGVISSGLSVSYATTSLNIKISYTSKDEKIICDAINKIIAVSQTKANSVDEDNDFIFPTIAKTISVVSNATKTTQTGMSKIIMLAIFIVIGGIIGVLIAFLKEILNNTVCEIDEIEKVNRVKVIGVIPSYNVKGRSRYV